MDVAERRCEQCGKRYTFDPHVNGTARRKFCSDDCAATADRERDHRRLAARRLGAAAEPWPEIPDLPEPPDWKRAYCATSSSWRFWTSSDPEERQSAKFMCLTRCEVLQACESWSTSLTEAAVGCAVYAGMSAAERTRRRKARLALARRVASGVRG